MNKFVAGFLLVWLALVVWYVNTDARTYEWTFDGQHHVLRLGR